MGESPGVDDAQRCGGLGRRSHVCTVAFVVDCGLLKLFGVVLPSWATREMRASSAWAREVEMGIDAQKCVRQHHSRKSAFLLVKRV